MSTSEVGAGNQYEAIRPRSFEDLSKTAASLNAQHSLGKEVKNDTLIATPSQEQSLWKTKSDSNKPSLSYPLSHLRLAKDPEEAFENLWMGSLLDALPLEVRQKLEEENNKPLEEQDATYTSLQTALEQASSLFSTIANITPEKGEFSTPSFFSPLGDLKKEALQDVKSFLEKMGPNTPFFDEMYKKLED